MHIKIIKIGRGDTNDVKLRNNTVSRNHLELFVNENGRVFVTDLGSTHGTTINGRRISGTVELLQGDILKLGFDRPLNWKKIVQEHAPEIKIPPQETEDNGNAVDERHSSSSQIEIFRKILWAFIFVLVLAIILLALGGKKKVNPETVSEIKVSKADSVVHQQPSPNPKKTRDNPDQRLDRNNNSGNPDIDYSSNSDPTSDNVGATIPDSSTPAASQPDNIKYDYSCLNKSDNDAERDILSAGSDLTDIFIDAVGDKVTLEDEVEYGEQQNIGLRDEFKFIEDRPAYFQLKEILNKLLRHIPNPRGFAYKVYLFDDPVINAFTAGGRIYFSTGMFSFCETEDEIACILAHEIYHNELGHINHLIKQAKLPGGNLLAFMTISFNQKRETACDLHGIDLAISAGYDGCSAVKLWKRMKESSEAKNEKSSLENLMRSHPYDDLRESCSRSHVSSNYQRYCP